MTPVTWMAARGRRSVGGYLDVGLGDGCSNIDAVVLGDNVFRDEFRGGSLYVRGMAYEVELGKYLAMVFSGLAVLVMIADSRAFWVAIRFLMATLSLDCDAASFSLFMVMVSTSFERFSAMAVKDSNTEGGYCFGGIE
ncbi:hypothetical protein Tco_0870162 [Tanacetum coccineum]